MVVLSDEGCEMRIFHEIFMGQVDSSNGVGLMGGAGYVGRGHVKLRVRIGVLCPAVKMGLLRIGL